MIRQPLFRKYVAVLVLLVSGTLAISGLLQLAFSFQQNQDGLVALQREKAIGAAARIQAFVDDVERQMSSAVPAPLLAVGPISPEQRRDELLRLLRQVPAISDVTYLDAAGREQVHLSRTAISALGSGVDRSGDPSFALALGHSTVFGEVYFQGQSEPYMTVSVPEQQPGNGVTVAQVNLKLIWDVVTHLQVGDAGYAYVVDRRGQLIAHPDLSLVLQHRDLSALPQVRAAKATVVSPREPTIARDLNDRQVLTARAVIERLGWSVFVEQPLEEAFAPLYSLVASTAVVLVGGLVLAVLASLVLARRLTRPIQQLQLGAARIGAGALDQRIDVRTGDELEALGDAFNSMSSQLRESYATLEQKVDERTRDLAAALERLRALGAVSETVSSTLDLEAVLSTVVAHAVQLSAADEGAIYEYDEPAREFRLSATSAVSHQAADAFGGVRVPLTGSILGRAAAEHTVVHVADVHVPPWNEFEDPIERAGARALLVVPLLRDERIVGGLVVWRATPGEFGLDTIDVLQTFARQSVLAIQNARLFQEIDRKSHQLEVASRHKSEFLANMSHELGTPLNAINGFSQVLMERLHGDLTSKQEAYLQDILGSGRHLLSLINDILDLSKVEAGRMELEPSTFSLAEALQNGLTMVRERATERGIAVGLDIDPSVDCVVGDEGKVKQIVFNLLSNAVKFTPDHGRIDVSARRIESELHVSVRDTGIGIAPADQQRIFEEFAQVRTGALHHSTEGTGLGLALARRFVELHGGHIWVDSQPGIGSTFTFSLPLTTVAVGTVLTRA